MQGIALRGGARDHHGVLFISHDATRTGAPTNLLHFLRWYKTNGRRPISVVLGGDGELLPAFQELGDVYLLGRSRWRRDAFRARALGRVGLGELARRQEDGEPLRFATRSAPELIYANSIATARIVNLIAPNVPVLTHLHELELVFQSHSGPALDYLLAKTRKFIACSNAVSENLAHAHRISPDRVETVHASIPTQCVRPERTREQVLSELQLPSSARLVAGCGTVQWIKGPDLFVQLARNVCARRSDTYFVWIGGGSEAELAQFEYDIRKAGLSERVRLTGAVRQSADYFGLIDLFALTSRQDSYPLSCLEAAALEKPIVCFAAAGGMPEFVEEDCGFVVPYLDVAAMADRVVSLIDCEEQRLKMGRAAHRKVMDRHDISVAGPRILEIIERTISGK